MCSLNPRVFCDVVYCDVICTGDKGQDDGVFYMGWDDFLQHFDGIDVCFVDRDMGSIRLDVKEEFSVCGAFMGCIIGEYCTQQLPLPDLVCRCVLDDCMLIVCAFVLVDV